MFADFINYILSNFEMKNLIIYLKSLLFSYLFNNFQKISIFVLIYSPLQKGSMAWPKTGLMQRMFFARLSILHVCAYHKLRDLSGPSTMRRVIRASLSPRARRSHVLHIPLNKNLSDLAHKSFLNPGDQRDFVPCAPDWCTSQIVIVCIMCRTRTKRTLLHVHPSFSPGPH